MSQAKQVVKLVQQVTQGMATTLLSSTQSLLAMPNSTQPPTATTSNAAYGNASKTGERELKEIPAKILPGVTKYCNATAILNIIENNSTNFDKIQFHIEELLPELYKKIKQCPLNPSEKTAREQLMSYLLSYKGEIYKTSFTPSLESVEGLEDDCHRITEGKDPLYFRLPDVLKDSKGLAMVIDGKSTQPNPAILQPTSTSLVATERPATIQLTKADRTKASERSGSLDHRPCKVTQSTRVHKELVTNIEYPQALHANKDGEPSGVLIGLATSRVTLLNALTANYTNYPFMQKNTSAAEAGLQTPPCKENNGILR